jgi:hypothetical protein
MEGSVAIVSPAIQPSTPEPAHATAGTKLRSESMKAAPRMVAGTVTESPITTSTAFPSAAAALNMAVVGKNYAVLERGSLRMGGFWRRAYR